MAVTIANGHRQAHAGECPGRAREFAITPAARTSFGTAGIKGTGGIRALARFFATNKAADLILDNFLRGFTDHRVELITNPLFLLFGQSHYSSPRIYHAHTLQVRARLGLRLDPKWIRDVHIFGAGDGR